MTRKTAFLEGWSWFKIQNSGLALGTNSKFYTSLSKGLKLKVRKFGGLISTLVEVTGLKIKQTQAADHARKDRQSHLVKHALTQNHRHIDLRNMKIIDSNFHNNKLKGTFFKHFTLKISAITEFLGAASRTQIC